MDKYVLHSDFYAMDMDEVDTGMILGAKFRSWANFPWFFQKRDSLF
jgi:hypothetical protein